MGSLASIYTKPPEQFVKKIRDRINERFDLEYEEDEVDVEYVDSTGQKREEYKAEANVESFGNLLDLDDDPSPTPSAPTEAPTTTGGLDDLMGLESPIPQATTPNPLADPLADLMGGPS